MKRVHWLGLSLAVGAGATFAACVGDAPINTDAGGSDATIDTKGDSALPDTGSDSTPQNDSGPSDAGSDVVDAAPVTTICTDPVNTSAYWQHCVASEVSFPPGGAITNGNYVLSRAWQQLYCPAAYVIGWGNVYVDTGHQFFRYYVERGAVINDPNPVKVTGTYWLDADGGNLVATEMCDPNNKGKSRVGQLFSDGGTFTMTWGDAGQESWDIR
jgi:hypothetical protein